MKISLIYFYKVNYFCHFDYKIKLIVATLLKYKMEKVFST